MCRNLIRILLADDHEVIRIGLRHIFEEAGGIEIIAEASNGLEAVNETKRLRPDVVLLDLYMPQHGGLEALTVIKQELPEAHVLVLTISEQREDLMRALTLGAHGYLVKGSSPTDIVEAVRRVVAGQAVLPTQMIAAFLATLQSSWKEPCLSTREQEVLSVLGEGTTFGEIADRLCITESTVRTHVHHILDKLHLKNTAQAIAYAAQHRPQSPTDTPGCL